MFQNSAYYKLLFFVMSYGKVTVPDDGYVFTCNSIDDLRVTVGHFVHPVTPNETKFLNSLQKYYEKVVGVKMVTSSELEYVLNFLVERLPLTGKREYLLLPSLSIFSCADLRLFRLQTADGALYLNKSQDGIYLVDREGSGIDIKSAVRMILYYAYTSIGTLFTELDRRTAFKFLKTRCSGEICIKKEDSTSATFRTSLDNVIIDVSLVSAFAWSEDAVVPATLSIDCILLLHEAWMQTVSDIGDLADAMAEYLSKSGVMPNALILQSLSTVIVESQLVDSVELCKVFKDNNIN